MDLHQVNIMLDKLVSLYEGKYKTAPEGKAFAECYDPVTLIPTQEYVGVYNEAIKIMTDLGLNYWK
jgi:methylamine--corrinoid protein Co-methyltransferase